MSKLTKKSLKQEGLPGTNLSISIVLSGLWFLWAHAGMCVYGCRRVITCLIWQPNYGGLLHHAALQNQTPWNWLPSHLDLICDSTFSPALPLSPALCWTLLIFMPSENKCPKDARVWSNGVLNYHSNNSNGGEKNADLFIFCWNVRNSRNILSKHIWQKTGRDKRKKERKEFIDK